MADKTRRNITITQENDDWLKKNQHINASQLIDDLLEEYRLNLDIEKAAEERSDTDEDMQKQKINNKVSKLKTIDPERINKDNAAIKQAALKTETSKERILTEIAKEFKQDNNTYALRKMNAEKYIEVNNE